MSYRLQQFLVVSFEGVDTGVECGFERRRRNLTGVALSVFEKLTS